MKSGIEVREIPEVNKCSEVNEQINNLQACPHCQHAVELIWVHGHYQCPKCKYVVMSCCGDS